MSRIQTIPIHTAPPYDVCVGGGLLSQCGPQLMKTLGRCHIAVIADRTVAPLFLGTAAESLRSAGFTVSTCALDAGEQNKTLRTLGEILDFLAVMELGRDDCVAALGGGVMGDLVGFAAGVYLRGIRYVQLPTTLLAMADASVGGKTGIDLNAGKNLAGLFLQPSAVLCDTDCLASLPPEATADGMAEVIKTGVLTGGALFESLEAARFTPDDVIASCVSYKAGVVERDERERGERKLLNLGHTAGHAIEVCSRYTVPHGHAVAAGLSIIARASVRLGWAEPDTANRISACLRAHDLPTRTGFPPQALAQAALADKKRRGDRITLVVPEAVGRCTLKEIPLAELESVLRAGWER